MLWLMTGEAPDAPEGSAAEVGPEERSADVSRGRGPGARECTRASRESGDVVEGLGPQESASVWLTRGEPAAYPSNDRRNQISALSRMGVPPPAGQIAKSTLRLRASARPTASASAWLAKCPISPPPSPRTTQSSGARALQV
jgi:hypothetical protein